LQLEQFINVDADVDLDSDKHVDETEDIFNTCTLVVFNRSVIFGIMQSK